MTARKLCRFPLCKEPATRGAYAWRDPKSTSVRWLYSLFCDAHGTEAIGKGARWMGWRPVARFTDQPPEKGPAA